MILHVKYRLKSQLNILNIAILILLDYRLRRDTFIHDGSQNEI